jgi:hypothetical protein
MLVKSLRAATALAALQVAACAPLAMALTAVAVVPAAQAQENVSVEMFHEELAAYGRWVEHPRYGFVWYPSDVDDDWRPYTRGHWVHTEEHGWLWSSDEEWGWATYHYGRWALDEDDGWFWVPGSEWGPAWVDWRTGDGHIGWAPLGPEVRWRGDSFDYGSADYASSRFMPYWIFVRDEHFLSRGIYRHCAPPSRNVVIHRQTRSSTSYVRHNSFIVNRSLSLGYVRDVTRRPVPSVRVHLVGRPGELGQHRRQGGSGGGDGPSGVAIFRPRIAAIDPRVAPRQVSPPPVGRGSPDRSRQGSNGDPRWEQRGNGDRRDSRPDGDRGGDRGRDRPADRPADRPSDRPGLSGPARDGGRPPAETSVPSRGRPEGQVDPPPFAGRSRDNDQRGDQPRDTRRFEPPQRPTAPPPVTQQPSARPQADTPRGDGSRQGSGPGPGGPPSRAVNQPPQGQPTQGQPPQGQPAKGQPAQGASQGAPQRGQGRRPPPADGQNPVPGTPGAPGASPGRGG